MKFTAISLGWEGVVAQLIHCGKDEVQTRTQKLIIYQSQIAEDGFCIPAQSIEVNGLPALITLRNALNKAYPPEEI